MLGDDAVLEFLQRGGAGEQRRGVPVVAHAEQAEVDPAVRPEPGLEPLAVLLGRLLRVALLGGAAMAAWDLFIDPQMVAAGHWRWAHPDPGLPGTAGVPLTNALGWLAASAYLALAVRPKEG